MTHVLIYCDDRLHTLLLETVCLEAGHDVTVVASADDTFMVLRTVLHPLVTLVNCERNVQRAFFATLGACFEQYGHHRYVAITSWQTTADELSSLSKLNVFHLPVPFQIETVPDLVAEAAASFSG